MKFSINVKMLFLVMWLYLFSNKLCSVVLNR
jgi:hypothetical protein